MTGTPTTREELDRQMQFSAILPDFADWVGWSARASAEVGGWTRHAFGPDPRQWVELRGETPGAVVPVFIHGGYWRAFDAGAHRFTGVGLTAVGPMTANAEYRLLPSVRMADAVADATTALCTVARLVPDARLLVIGHSAGAQLAHWAVERSGLPDGRIVGLVAISGVYDLEPVSRCFVQEEIALTPEEVAAYSPLSARVRPGLRRLVVTGAEETPLYRAQAARYAAASGGRLAQVAGAHHMSVLGGLARPGSGLCRAIADFAAGREVGPEIEESSW